MANEQTRLQPMKPMWTSSSQPPVLFRAGPLLVASSRVVLPQTCIQCGATPATETIKKNFTWHHPALYLLVVGGVLLYAVVAILIQKKNGTASSVLC
jgi:hypothetical protein